MNEENITVVVEDGVEDAQGWHEFSWKGITHYGCDSCGYTTEYIDNIVKHVRQHIVKRARETGVLDSFGREIVVIGNKEE